MVARSLCIMSQEMLSSVTEWEIYVAKRYKNTHYYFLIRPALPFGWHILSLLTSQINTVVQSWRDFHFRFLIFFRLGGYRNDKAHPIISLFATQLHCQYCWHRFVRKLTTLYNLRSSQFFKKVVRPPKIADNKCLCCISYEWDRFQRNNIPFFYKYVEPTKGGFLDSPISDEK